MVGVRAVLVHVGGAVVKLVPVGALSTASSGLCCRRCQSQRHCYHGQKRKLQFEFHLFVTPDYTHVTLQGNGWILIIRRM